MKKRLWKSTLALLLTLVMILSSGVLNAFAFAVSSDAAEEDAYYTIALEDGVLKIKVNPEKLNDVIKDGALTKEELLKFVPEDVLETLGKKEDITVDDLTALVSNYVSPDQLRELLSLIPTATLSKHFDLSTLTSLLTVDEILGLVDVNELLASVEEDDVRALLNDEAVSLMLVPELEALITTKVIDDLMAKTDLVDVILSNDDLEDKIVTTALVAKLYKEGYLTSISVDDALDSALNKGYVTESELIDLFGSSVDLDHVTIDDVIATDLLTRAELVDVLGGEDKLKTSIVGNPSARKTVASSVRTNENISLADYWEYVDIMQFIQSVGGYETVLSVYTPDEIKNIVKAIGTENIKAFVTDSGIAEQIDFKQLALDALELVKAKKGDIKAAAKSICEGFISLLLSDVSNIFVNDYAIFTNGAFDINMMLYSALVAIPDTEKLFSLGADDVFAEYTVKFDLANDAEDFELGIECSFLGDPANLLATLAKFKNVFDLDVDEDLNVNASLILPDKIFADVYKSVLESEKVSDNIKKVILVLPYTNIGNVEELLSNITDEQIQSLIDKLLEDKVQSKIDGLEEGPVRTYAQKLYDKFVSVEAFNSYRDKVIEALAKLPEGAKAKTVADFYTSNGEWHLSGGASIDLYEQISKVVTLPEEVKILFNNDFRISASLNADLRTVGIYEATFVTPDGNVKAFLPVGVSLDVMKALAPSNTGWTLGDGVDLDVMPNGDLSFYNNDDYNYIRFINSDNDEVIDIVRYEEGAETIREPRIPEKPGYTASWAPYELNRRNVIDVYSVYEIFAVYQVEFVVEGNVIDVVEYSHGDKALERIPDIADGSDHFLPGYTYSWPEEIILDNTSFTVEAIRTPIKFTVNFVANNNVIKSISNVTVETVLTGNDIPNIPSKMGNTGAWDSTDVSDYSLVVDGVRTITAVYTPRTYTVTFMADGVPVGNPISFTYGALSVNAPPVPEKLGYTGAWAPYDLQFPGNITVNAVYTPIIYKASFYADNVLVGVVEFTVEDQSIVEPAVPAKDGYTGKWESYTLGAGDITINAVYTSVSSAPVTSAPPSDGGTTTAGDGGLFGNSTFWWILIVILLLIIIALVVFLILKNRNDDDDDDNTPDPTPVVEPVAPAEEANEVEADDVAAPAEKASDIEIDNVAAPADVEIPESLDAIAADSLMSDELAMEAVQVVYSEKKAGRAKAIINIGIINSSFADGDTVNLETLKEKNLIPAKTDYLKILANGSLDKALNIEANSFSVQTIKMIQLKGGSVTLDR